MIRVLILLFAVVALPRNVLAQNSPTHIRATLSLGLITQVNLVVSDQVSENCWTNANNIKANLRLKFEQNDIEVLQYEPVFLTIFHPKVIIDGSGYRSQNGWCVGNASLRVYYFFQSSYDDPRTDSDHYVITGNSVPFERGITLTTPQDLNNQFSTFFDTVSSELIADILTAQRNEIIVNFRQAYPHLADKPISMVEWKKTHKVKK